MAKESPWAGGWKPHKTTETQEERAEAIIQEVCHVAISLFIERVQPLPVAEQGAIAMLIADQITATFIGGLARGDPKEIAAYMTMHTVNVMRRCREEYDDE